MGYRYFLVKGAYLCSSSGGCDDVYRYWRVSHVREGGIVTRHSQEEAASTLDVISHSSAQTQRLGMRLGELMRGGELLLLEGQLGTGKTTFTQGLARGMGINDIINSPTFTLLKEYKGQPVAAASSKSLQRQQRGPTLYHFDLYRLDDPEEILDLGFEEYFFGDATCSLNLPARAHFF